jgi:hypothetical protein
MPSSSVLYTRTNGLAIIGIANDIQIFRWPLLLIAGQTAFDQMYKAGRRNRAGIEISSFPQNACALFGLDGPDY